MRTYKKGRFRVDGAIEFVGIRSVGRKKGPATLILIEPKLATSKPFTEQTLNPKP